LASPYTHYLDLADSTIYDPRNKNLPVSVKEVTKDGIEKLPRSSSLDGYPLVNIHIAIEAMAIEIVSFSMKNCYFP